MTSFITQVAHIGYTFLFEKQNNLTFRSLACHECIKSATQRRGRYLERFRLISSLTSLLTLLLWLGTAITPVNAQIIDTVAGGGIGDGGLATAATMYSPVGVAVDSSGNLYIADFYHDRIRKVTKATGFASTIAGTTGPGYNGDNIAAASAALFRPIAVAVDRLGNVYIADTGNYRIRKVDATTGLISTVAGTGSSGYNGDNIAATSATVNPGGITVDASGNLYIADNNRIRKVAASTGIITTVAGANNGVAYNGDNIAATTASLAGPKGIAIDSVGNLYIADSGNQRIRKVTATTGIITTIAGTGASGLYGENIVATNAALNSPSDVAVDASGNIYIADTESNRVRKVTVATGIITTVGGDGTASVSYTGDNIPAVNTGLNRPGGIAVDLAGNLYVAEQNTIIPRFLSMLIDAGNRVRKVNAATGIITTVAGTGRQFFGGDGGLATNATLSISYSSSLVFYNPPAISGVAVDAAGNLYITDRGNARVRKLTAATGIISSVVGTGLRGDSGDGVPALAATLIDITGVAVDSAGNLYIADRGANRIRKVAAATGMISTVAGTGVSGYGGDNSVATSAMLDGPSGVAVDSVGNLYIADSRNLRVRKVTAATGIITTVAGTGIVSYLNGVPTYPYNGDNVTATGANLSQTVAVAVDAIGNVYIADYDNNRVRKVNATTGIITNIAGTGATDYNGDDIDGNSATLHAPTGVAVDSSGSVYIADSGHRRLRKVNASTGVITTIAGPDTPGTNEKLDVPYGIAMDSSGNAYVVDYNRVRKVSFAPLPSYQGLWWKAPADSESGWGINLAHQGNDLFATWFTYDATGKGMWLSMTAGKSGPDYIGTLYQTRGPPFSAVPFNPAAITRTPVGSGKLTFSDKNNGSFAYILDGITQTKAITRQIFGPVPACVFGAQVNLALATNYQDLWWAAPGGIESGWGVNFTHQGDTIFATWFTYDADGSPLWLSATVLKTGLGSYSGTLFRTTGPAFSSVPFLSANVGWSVVGTMTLSFANGNSGTFMYTAFGVSQSKAITRQVFNNPGTVCQ